MTALTYGSLFSGAGGLDMAVEALTGATCAWHAEVDPHASKVLAERWPGVPNLGDVSAIDWNDVPPVDVLCGGFPCQDISTAGRGAGIAEGTRSGLWYRYADAIRHLRPKLVLVENVAALVVRGLDVVVGSLAEIGGYEVRWGCVRASDVGAPHRRERLWIVAWPAADAPDIGYERCRPSRYGWPGPADGRIATADADDKRHEGTKPGPFRHDGRGDSGSPAANTSGARLGQHPRGASAEEAGARAGHVATDHRGSRAAFDWRATPYAAAIKRWEPIVGRRAPDPTDDRGRLNPRLAEWMMGWPDGWVTDLGPRTAALKMIGNGVCPQQAEAAYRWILEAEAVAA